MAFHKKRKKKKKTNKNNIVDVIIIIMMIISFFVFFSPLFAFGFRQSVEVFIDRTTNSYDATHSDTYKRTKTKKN